MAAATSWPVDDNPRSLQNCLQPAPQMMKAACFGWFWPSAMNLSHLPWIVAVDGRWSSQNADGHTAHRNSNPPACAAFRPQVSQEWCGQPHEPNFFVGSAKPIFCKQPACHRCRALVAADQIAAVPAVEAVLLIIIVAAGDLSPADGLERGLGGLGLPARRLLVDLLRVLFPLLAVAESPS